jgi:hypothetical protein
MSNTSPGRSSKRNCDVKRSETGRQEVKDSIRGRWSGTSHADAKRKSDLDGWWVSLCSLMYVSSIFYPVRE